MSWLSVSLGSVQRELPDTSQAGAQKASAFTAAFLAVLYIAIKSDEHFHERSPL